MKQSIKFVRSLILFGSLFLIMGCSTDPKEITLYYSIHEPMGKTAILIHEILEEELNLKVKTKIGSGTVADLEQIRKEEGHLALIENHIGFQNGIKALMPMYSQVLHVFYKGERQSEFKEILAGKEVFLGYMDDGSYVFALKLLDYFNIDPSTFQRTEDPFTAEVLFGFTDIISNRNLQALKSYNIFSFDKDDEQQMASITSGISLKFPKVRPFVIPEGTYNLISGEPIYTIASDVVLVAGEQLSDDLVYEITRTIFQNLQKFNNISPLISQDLREDFDRASLSFPLHNGARVYLERDEPTFAERYAELFGVVLSLMLAVTSGVYSFSRWMKQRKKDRIDEFYQEIMKVKSNTHHLTDKNQITAQIRKLKSNQQKAFQMLVDEKLMANESFRIYMELSKEAIQELKLHYKKIR